MSALDYRGGLDAEMRHLLVQLAVCSHVPAASLAERSSGPKPDTVIPTGDVGPGYALAARYGPPFHPVSERHPGAQDDDERARLVRAARREARKPPRRRARHDGPSVRREPAGARRPDRRPVRAVQRLGASGGRKRRALHGEGGPRRAGRRWPGPGDGPEGHRPWVGVAPGARPAAAEGGPANATDRRGDARQSRRRSSAGRRGRDGGLPLHLRCAGCRRRAVRAVVAAVPVARARGAWVWRHVGGVGLAVAPSVPER